MSHPGDETAPIDLSQVRTDYDRAGLRRHDLEADPIDQFGHWMRDAMNSLMREPTAMTLATVEGIFHLAETVPDLIPKGRSATVLADMLVKIQNPSL